MAPSVAMPLVKRERRPDTPGRASMGLVGIIAEGWSEGFQLGALIILMLVTICNLRRGVLLHKLILIEQFMAVWVCLTIFQPDPKYGWWFASAMGPLYISYTLHNVISWMKIRPFLKKRGSMIYLVTLFVVQPYWVFALYAVFVNWNGFPHNHYAIIRPWESTMREPWWVFTTIFLVITIKRVYQSSLLELFRISNRFAVLIFCMFLSVAFVFTDLIVTAGDLLPQNGMNPFWHLALVFKCASDTIFLDDFKKVLNDLVNVSMSKAKSSTHTSYVNASQTNSQARPSVSHHPMSSSFGSPMRSPPTSPMANADATNGTQTTNVQSPQSVRPSVRSWPREFFSSRSDNPVITEEPEEKPRSRDGATPQGGIGREVSITVSSAAAPRDRERGDRMPRPPGEPRIAPNRF
ncbi:MAG: hypothetical protein M1833_005570 [Piccolia ochrophora]|nr:MAG: hypothetical protein M1833_005570 [Piccolia ochrophora]